MDNATALHERQTVVNFVGHVHFSMVGRGPAMHQEKHSPSTSGGKRDNADDEKDCSSPSITAARGNTAQDGGVENRRLLYVESKGTE